MRIIFLSIAWVLGIWLGYRFNLPPALGLVGLVPLPALIFTRKYRKAAVLSSLCIILLAGAAVHSYSSLYGTNESKVHFYNDTGMVEVKGMVASDPDIRDKSARLTVDVTEIKVGEARYEVEGKALVTVPRYPAYQYGDVLVLTGELETPAALDGFDYRGYLEHQGIYATVYFPQIETLETGRGSWFFKQVYALRSRLSQVLAEVLPEPQAALAQGIVLGIRGNIPAELNDSFSRSGTTHLLAISGMNIGIMAGILLGIGAWLFGRRHYYYIWLALGATWLYTLLTGMNPPVVRGAIMASVFLAAEAFGRQRSGLVTLALAAAVMTGIHPYVLGDVSFQLSFLAMAGLIFVFPLLRNAGRKIVASKLGEEGVLAGAANAIVDTWSATLGAIIAVWPVVAYYFGFVSLAGPAATFLAIPAIPGIIITGGLAAVVGLASIAAGQVIGWIAWLFLSYLMLVVEGLAALSFSSVDVSAIHPALIWGYYIALAALLWFVNRRQRARSPAAGSGGRMEAGLNMSFGLRGSIRWIVVPLAILAALSVFTAAAMPDDDLHVSFLDVGEGDAALIEKGTRQALIDGGPSPRDITLELSRQMPFWDRTIDLLVLTHPHADHLAGLVETLRRYKVERVVYAAAEGYAAPLYDEWLRLIEEKGVKSEIARAGMRIDLGDGVVLRVLNPPENPLTGTESDIDNNSMTLRLSAGDISFLFTADIMAEGEREMVLSRADLKSTVLKAAHHGSDTSTTNAFLAVVNPEVAVISVGKDNRFGHPKAEILERLGEKAGLDNIYRTDTQGTIEFITDGERLWVEAGKK